MGLFQHSILKKHARQLHKRSVERAWQVFTNHFHNPKVQENIRKAKEEQYQEGFLDDLFVKVFGYTKNPAPDFNLTTELKNAKDAKKTDGAILQLNKALAVIELKGMNTTNLNKVEPQAFGYKNNQPNCVYVITSNFRKLRFYIDNAVEFEEFDLFELTRERFDLLWLCLAKNSLLKGVPKQMKTESLLREEEITQKLYNDYSDFRNTMFENLVKNNPTYDKLTLFKKTQKLLDRFLFIFFAEDRGLLPPNISRKILSEWQQLEELNEYRPLFQHCKKHFGYLNKGYKGKKYDIFAYNGGLFANDKVLDKVKIDDNILYNYIFTLSGYDFASEISVNILGHIFEHSLTEIEEIQAEINADKPLENIGKRKKDGVFYTPKYVTKYIVEQTIGRFCEAKKATLNFVEDDFYEKKKVTQLKKQLETYRNWLLQITICDPACGSGAFLNQALEFLLAEHEYLDNLERQISKSKKIGIKNVADLVLRNNIFGVDINEESVEIAKLSLWLHTAQQGRKLVKLNDNIKCGNSLIDDVEVAGEKAFSWQNEFSNIFSEKAGFDIVVGNPPYGAKMPKVAISYLIEKMKTQGLSKRMSDSYLAFYIQALSFLLKKEGVLGFITPNTWRLTASGQNFRNYILSENLSLYHIVQHSEKVFPDATVDVDSVFLQKTNDKQFIDITIGDIRKETNYQHRMLQKDLCQKDYINLYMTQTMCDLKKKIAERSFFVKDFYDIKNGVKPYERGKGKPKQTAETLQNKPFTSKKQLDASFVPLIGGSQFHKYRLLWNSDYWIKYGKHLAAPRDKTIFEAKEKLIFRQTSDSIIGTLIGENYVMRNNTHILLKNEKSIIELKALLAILNSRLIDFYYWTMNPERGEVLAEVKAFHIGLLPFPKTEISETFFAQKADEILSFHENLQSQKNRFLRRVKNSFAIEKMSRKLQFFYNYDFRTFVLELKKLKIKLSLREQDVWDDYYLEYKGEIDALKMSIVATNKAIDAAVYDLYDLTEEEVKVVER
ncbi:MAG: Eco57I restriction-modification methylase domain-containing protein [Chitinophagales bacterium]